jgi:hypothetical protein
MELRIFHPKQSRFELYSGELLIQVRRAALQYLQLMKSLPRVKLDCLVHMVRPRRFKS